MKGVLRARARCPGASRRGVAAMRSLLFMAICLHPPIRNAEDAVSPAVLRNRMKASDFLIATEPRDRANPHNPAFLFGSRSATVPDSILYVAWASWFLVKTGFPIVAKTGYTECDLSLF